MTPSRHENRPSKVREREPHEQPLRSGAGVGPACRVLRTIAVHAVLLAACTPGTLTDEEEQQLRSELESLYAPEPTVPPTSSSGGETDAPAEETDVAAETDMMVTDDVGTDDGDGEMPTDVEPPPGAGIPDCVSSIFTTSCAGAACHYDGVFNFPPDLERDGLFELLTTEQTTCEAVPRYVDLDNPEQSLIKLKLEPAPPCGAQMPPTGSPPLTDDQKTCMENWFDALSE